MTDKAQTENIEKEAEPTAPESNSKEQDVPKKEKKDKKIKVSEAEYQQAIADAAEFKDKYIRLFAEFDNARKRMDRDKAEFVKYANEVILIDYLAIFDNLELTIQAAKQRHEDTDALIKGIEMVLAQAQEVLKKNGVTVIEAKGKPFDPHAHEILLQEESEEHEEGIVLDELQKGYRLGDKVIRTVKVKISAKKPQ